MLRLLTIGILSLLGVTALLVHVPVVQAEERTCRGTLGATTVDNLRVPPRASCTLNGTRVKSTLKVETGATLKAYGIRVVGNVQAEGATRVNVLSNSVIGGSIQIVQGAAATIRYSRINGDLLFDENGRYLEARSNRVGGNLQAFQNTGGVYIYRNTIDGNLQCKANEPRPTGGGNIVYGNKEDQCRRL